MFSREQKERTDTGIDGQKRQQQLLFRFDELHEVLLSSLRPPLRLSFFRFDGQREAGKESQAWRNISEKRFDVSLQKLSYLEPSLFMYRNSHASPTHVVAIVVVVREPFHPNPPSLSSSSSLSVAIKTFNDISSCLRSLIPS